MSPSNDDDQDKTIISNIDGPFTSLRTQVEQILKDNPDELGRVGGVFLIRKDGTAAIIYAARPSQIALVGARLSYLAATIPYRED